MLIAGAIGGVVLAQGSKETGRIGPSNKIQPSGRQLVPAGKRTIVGNHPGGGALTPNGRFYWTLSAGRGRNDIRIVRTGSALRCKRARKPRRPPERGQPGTQALPDAGATLPGQGPPQPALSEEAQGPEEAWKKSGGLTPPGD